jgi:hypothetical protein
VPKESIKRNKRDHYKDDEPNRPPCLCENALGWDLSKCGRRGKDLGSIRLAEETRLEKKAQEEDRIQAEIQPHADRFHSLRTTVVISGNPLLLRPTDGVVVVTVLPNAESKSLLKS